MRIHESSADLASRALWLQGFAVRISKADLTGERLEEAVLEVLSDTRYATAAAGVSRKLRARKRAPVQEAAGAHCHTSLAFGNIRVNKMHATKPSEMAPQVISTGVCSSLCSLWLVVCMMPWMLLSR